MRTCWLLLSLVLLGVGCDDRAAKVNSDSVAGNKPGNKANKKKKATKKTTTKTASPPPSPPPSGAKTAEAGSFKPVSDSLSDLLVQADKLVKLKSPKAGLYAAYFSPVEKGKVKWTKRAAVSVEFQYRWFDKKQPPGKDLVAGSLRVFNELKPLVLKVGQESSSHMELAWKENGNLPLPMPKCTSDKAWAEAVKSGIPADSVVRVEYGRMPPYGPLQVFRWAFFVDGHPELTRNFDPHTCARIKDALDR